LKKAIFFFEGMTAAAMAAAPADPAREAEVQVDCRGEQIIRPVVVKKIRGIRKRPIAGEITWLKVILE
jgi:hypothetical protein